MANFNKVILAGNLTRDPELRYTPKGTAVAKLGMAINRSWTTETGEKREEATFVDVDAFGKQAEVISQYLRKGRSLLVETWDDKATGAKRSKLGVVLESFSFLDSGNREGGGGSGSSAPQAGAVPAPRPQRPAPSAPAPASQDGPPPDDDDVPF